MPRFVDITLNGNQRRPVPRDVQDGIADLRDYTTSQGTNTTTPVAGEAISGLYRLCHLGESDKVTQAYSALHRLRERNSETFGPDIPIDHQTVYKGFRSVLETLIYAIERDWHKELKQHDGARRR